MLLVKLKMRLDNCEHVKFKLIKLYFNLLLSRAYELLINCVGVEFLWKFLIDIIFRMFLDN